jgi:hypothetical protein
MNKEPTTQTNNPADRRWDRTLARLRATSLDRQLASGTPPGWNRPLAARARYITGTERGQTLVTDWKHLLDACTQPRAARTLRTPLCRDRILAAEADIHDMLAAISEARLESAAGVAMASLLLRDGTGPLYNRHCPTDLTAAIRNATTHIRNRTPAHLATT